MIYSIYLSISLLAIVNPPNPDAAKITLENCFQTSVDKDATCVLEIIENHKVTIYVRPNDVLEMMMLPWKSPDVNWNGNYIYGDVSFRIENISPEDYLKGKSLADGSVFSDLSDLPGIDGRPLPAGNFNVNLSPPSVSMGLNHPLSGAQQALPFVPNAYAMECDSRCNYGVMAAMVSDGIKDAGLVAAGGAWMGLQIGTAVGNPAVGSIIGGLVGTVIGAGLGVMEGYNEGMAKYSTADKEPPTTEPTIAPEPGTNPAPSPVDPPKPTSCDPSQSSCSSTPNPDAPVSASHELFIIPTQRPRIPIIGVNLTLVQLLQHGLLNRNIPISNPLQP